MKARASYFPPDDAAGSLPDITCLTARYGRLLLLFKVLIAAGDFTKGLAVSRDIGRAARRLMRGRAQAATRAVKAKMLACPGWRARVIADLGGVRKLALWNAAMDRAIKRARDRRTLWQPPQPACGAQIITRESAAADAREAARRAHIRACAKACVNPAILIDPFRVDQDGLFRLPPVPRAPRSLQKAGRKRLREYTYDARPRTKLTGHFAPAPVWPAEFYLAERGNIAAQDRAKAFAFGPTPGGKRHPARRDISGARRRVQRAGRAPAGVRVYAPP